jgi:5-methylcytosine-specific restriction enzyme A
VGSGQFTSEIDEDEHWDGSGSLAGIGRACLGLVRATTRSVWDDYVNASVFRSPEEPTGRFPEGAVRRVEVNRYERDRRARAACIAHHGTACSVCGFGFEKSYGVLGRGFIHVHHLTEISAVAPT